jgi:hypothetical protein
VSTPRADGPPLPENPELRAIALAMEHAGLSGEICDATWQLVFISSEEARIVGSSPEVGRQVSGPSPPEDPEF